YQGSQNTNPLYFVQDYHGSVIGYTDGSGNLQALYKYGPYGEPKNISNGTDFTGARFRYTGQTVLPEAGLYYYKARVYDPIMGHFLQTDPIGSKDDLDLYAYTADDPIDKADPTGLMYWTDGGFCESGCDGFGPDPKSKKVRKGLKIFDNIFVTSNILGDDAHDVLGLYAAEQGGEWFSNVSKAPDGTIFDGRPDLGNTDTFKLWELKTPLGAMGGIGQLFDYSISSFGKYKPANGAPSFFFGNQLILPGAFGMITYTYQTWGIITYKYNTNKNVVKLPGLVPLPGHATATNVVPSELPMVP
ncbi:MAG TPA: RHS repeat-associated core domain-containing protein, partial [Alphaproteobacteria bacterium]